MTQQRTKVRVKANPKSVGFVYGSLQSRRDAGLRDVQVYFVLPVGGERRNNYDIDELEEIKE